MNKLWSRKHRLAKEKMYLSGDSIEWKSRINSSNRDYKELFRYLEKEIPISKNYNNITYIKSEASGLDRYYRFNGEILRIDSCELSLDVYVEDILIDLDIGKSLKIGAISMLTEEQSCYLKYLMTLSYYIVLKVNKGYYQMYDYRFHNVNILDDFLELEVTVVPNS